MHRQIVHLRIGIIGQELALDYVRIFDNLRYVIDRSYGDLRLFEKRDIFVLIPLNDEGAQYRIKLFSMGNAIRVRAETRILQDVGPADDIE